MAGSLNKYKSAQIKKIIRDGVAGKYNDGGGLYLRIRDAKPNKPAPKPAWIFLFTLNGRRREMRIAAYQDADLSKARDMATAARALIIDGKDPLAERKRTSEPYFKDLAQQVIDGKKSGWRSDKTLRQWQHTLDHYCAPLHKSLPSTITIHDVRKILSPIWDAKPETARRVRMRIEAFMTAAIASGYHAGPNPALWRGNLSAFLNAKRPKPKHHAALPYVEAPAFMAELRQREAQAARLLEFMILTNARGKEARMAVKSEFSIDPERGPVWIIPAERMKAEIEHHVPLSERALELANTAMEFSPNELVFPNHNNNAKPFSVNAPRNVLHRMGYGHITSHGWRSVFKDYCSDKTNYSREVIEHAMAHQLEDKAEAAYRRGTAFEKRRGLMDLWAQYLSSESAQIVAIRV